MTHNISVALLPTLLSPTRCRHACAIVVDVLRATSVMATAGRNGAVSVQTCSDVDQARRLALDSETSVPPLLCGERACVPIEGFDLGNSPAEYGPDVVAGRHVLMTTSNGTRAIAVAREAQRLLVASFLNLSATVSAIAQETDLVIICAGTDGRISYEDVLLAGAIAQSRDSDGSATMDDSARLAVSAWQQVHDSGQTLADAFRQSLGGRNLIRSGYEMDLNRCAVIDSIDGIVERTATCPTDPTVATFLYR